MLKNVTTSIRDLNMTIGNEVIKRIPKPDNIKNLTQIRIMIFLMENQDKDIYQIDICNAIRLKKSSITEHLDYLENHDYIKRVPDKNDKRRNKICLAKKAIAKQEEFIYVINDLNNDLTKGLSKNEINSFLKIINKMVRNIEGE